MSQATHSADQLRPLGGAGPRQRGGERKRSTPPTSSPPTARASVALLRKDGLYRSQLSDWRKASAHHGDAGLAGKKRGRKAVAGATANKLEMRKRDRRIARLERELAQAKFIIEIQKNASEMMALSEPLDDENAP